MKVYIICKHTNWNYGKIVKESKLSKSQMTYVTKRDNEHGRDVWDALGFGCPSKITKVIFKKGL